MCVCVCVICYQANVSVLVCLVFLFILFYFRKIFFLLETSSPGYQRPSHRAGEAAAVLFETVLIFPHAPKQELLGLASEGTSVSPCLVGRPGGGEGPSATMEVSDCGTQSGFCFLPVF